MVQRTRYGLSPLQELLQLGLFRRTILYRRRARLFRDWRRGERDALEKWNKSLNRVERFERWKYQVYDPFAYRETTDAENKNSFVIYKHTIELLRIFQSCLEIPALACFIRTRESQNCLRKSSCFVSLNGTCTFLRFIRRKLPDILSLPSLRLPRIPSCTELCRASGIF